MLTCGNNHHGFCWGLGSGARIKYECLDFTTMGTLYWQTGTQNVWMRTWQQVELSLPETPMKEYFRTYWLHYNQMTRERPSVNKSVYFAFNEFKIVQQSLKRHFHNVTTKTQFSINYINQSWEAGKMALSHLQIFHLGKHTFKKSSR